MQKFHQSYCQYLNFIHTVKFNKKTIDPVLCFLIIDNRYMPLKQIYDNFNCQYKPIWSLLSSGCKNSAVTCRAVPNHRLSKTHHSIFLSAHGHSMRSAMHAQGSKMQKSCLVTPLPASHPEVCHHTAIYPPPTALTKHVRWSSTLWKTRICARSFLG